MRNRLPNPRENRTFELEFGGLRYTATVSRFPDGRVGEVFLNNRKTASHADSCARDSAIAASLALQFGCPLKTLRNALLRDARGNPQTPLAAALDIIAGEERNQ